MYFDKNKINADELYEVEVENSDKRYVVTGEDLTTVLSKQQIKLTYLKHCPKVERSIFEKIKDETWCLVDFVNEVLINKEIMENCRDYDDTALATLASKYRWISESFEKLADDVEKLIEYEQTEDNLAENNILELIESD